MWFAPVGIGMTVATGGATHPPCEDPGVVSGGGSDETTCLLSCVETMPLSMGISAQGLFYPPSGLAF